MAPFKEWFMKWTSVILLVTVFAIRSELTYGQIVNMESQRYHTDTTGWKGSISGDFELTNYGQKVLDANANAHVQYQSLKGLYLLLGNYGFLRGGGQSFVDYGFLHFRYNYKAGRFIRLEAFTQLQQNAVTKIQSRFLMGTGPRLKLISDKKLKLYLGLLTVYEIEKVSGITASTRDWRFSDYLSMTYMPNEQMEFVTTTYYQPVIEAFKDYRLLNQCMFKIKAGKKLSVYLSWNYQFDATPAPDVPRETYSFSTGLELSL